MTRTEPALSTRDYLREKAKTDAKLKAFLRRVPKSERRRAVLRAAVMPLTPNQVLAFELDNQRSCFPAVEAALSASGVEVRG